ncbi:MAG: MarR family transcriptional regulator [Woeseiaceae bacterium]|nr:MarR family transcriptional regulator [Woeseiaceae bacterium]
MSDSVKQFDLNQYLPCQLATVSHTIMRSIASILEDRFGITTPEWKVLAIIAEKPGLSAVSVARLAEMDTVAVSRAVTKLLDRGLIDRELDSEDRRRSVLNLSADGADLYQQVIPVAEELEASLIGDFADEERRVLEKAIRVLRTKSKELADGLTSTPARLGLETRMARTSANSDRYRPQRPGPLVGHRLNGTTTFG